MAARGESSTALVVVIVFLVFFILLSMFLGVTTYLGYDGQAKLRSDLNTTKTDLKNTEDDKVWYRFQALLYRDYLGKLGDLKDPIEKDANALKAIKEDRDLLDSVMKPDGKPLKPGLSDSRLREPKVTELVEELKKNPGWDVNSKTLQGRVKDEVEKLKKDEQKARQEVANKEQALKDAATALANAEKEYRKERDLRIAELDKLKKEFEGRLVKLQESEKDLQETIKALSTEVAKLKTEKDDLAAEKDKKIAVLTTDYKDLEKRAEKVQIKLDQITSSSIQKAVEDNNPKGKIVALDTTGNLPFINLGSADNVRPQLTFSIFGVGPDGRSTGEYKGSLEVVKIVQDHLSQAKITETRDASRNPILKGDLLFNPVWNPNLKTRVAIAGIIDLSGEGRDQTAEFIRLLERQGIVVDAYLDVKEKKVKGELRRQTDYLILGDAPDAGAGAIQGDDPKEKERRAVTDLMDEMTAKGIRLAVPPISLRKFLVISGIRTPGSSGATRPVNGLDLKRPYK